MEILLLIVYPFPTPYKPPPTTYAIIPHMPLFFGVIASIIAIHVGFIARFFAEIVFGIVIHAVIILGAVIAIPVAAVKALF